MYFKFISELKDGSYTVYSVTLKNLCKIKIVLCRNEMNKIISIHVNEKSKNLHIIAYFPLNNNEPKIVNIKKKKKKHHFDLKKKNSK